MFEVVIVIASPVLILLAIRSIPPERRHRYLPWLFMAAYGTRLLVATFARDIAFFSSGPGGDSQGYEAQASLIAKMWSYEGIRYMTENDLPGIGETTLPQNLFALVTYLNGGAAHIGCCALLAAIACFTVIQVHAIAIELGATRDHAIVLAAFVLFLPSYVLYTSDTYKDGLVLFFLVGSLGTAIRLARRFAIRDIAFAYVFLLGLWLTRFYLVYAMFASIVIGTIGVRSRSVFRSIMTGLALATVLVVAVTYSSAATDVAVSAGDTFQRGTAEQVIAANAAGGSGVEFASDSPFGAFVPKLLYTLFSPFPWQQGSLGLQIGKLECLAWYYVAYRAFRAAKHMWARQKGDLAILLGAIVPMVLVYTVSFANIGLVLRERMGIVVCSAIIATLSPRAKSLEVHA